MDIQNFHSLLEAINSSAVKEAEAEFNNLIQNDPALLLQLLVNSIQTFQDKTVNFAITLLGRTATLIGPNLINIGNDEFHNSFQSSLLSLIQSHINDFNLVPSLSNAISTFAAIYQLQQRWPTFCVSLLQFIYQPDQGLVAPSPNSPLSSFIATEIIYHCINNDIIELNQEIIQYIITVIQAVFQNVSTVESHQLVSTVKLALYSYLKVQIDELSALSMPIVKIIPTLPPNSIDDYLRAISLFSDLNTTFFAPAIGDLMNTLLQILNESQDINLSRNISCINILTQVICNDKYFETIEPKSFDFYQMFLMILSRSPFNLDPEEGLDRSNIMMVTEDAIESLSNYFAEANTDLHSNVWDLFNECLSNNDINHVIANLIGFSKAVSGCASIFSTAIINEAGDDVDLKSNPDFLNVYKTTILNEDPKMRCIGIESLTTVMRSFGEYLRNFGGNEIIPIIAEAISKEPLQIILTELLKSLKIYLTCFCDYTPMCPAIMNLLGARFPQMNEKQQIRAMKCYYQISIIMNDEFVQFMPPIFAFMQQLLSNYRVEDDFPVNLFFTCMKLAPMFTCIPDEEFLSLSQSILRFVSSITDFSIFSSKQMDSMNEAICAILKRNPQQFLPYAAKIVNMIFDMAMKDIEFESIPANSNDINYSDETIAVFNEKTNTINIYSNSSINSLCETIFTLNDLLTKVNEIIKLNGFAQNIINAIRKTFIQGYISKRILTQTFSLVYSFFLAAKKNGMLQLLFTAEQPAAGQPQVGKPVATQIYLQQITVTKQIIDSVKDFQGFIESEKFLKNLLKSFIYFCKAFQKVQDESQNQMFIEILNNTILLLVGVYQKSLFIRLNTVRVALYSDEMLDTASIDKIVGSFFGAIFLLMSPLISPGILQFLCTTFDIQSQQQKENNNNGIFISTIVFDFWRFYVLLCPGCSREQGIQIISLIRDLIANNALELSVGQYALSTMMKSVVGITRKPANGNVTNNSYGYDELLESTLQFLANFFEPNQKSHITLYGSYANKEILIMAQKLVENQFDPSSCLQVLINLMPIDCILDDFTYSDYDGDDILLDDLLSTMNMRCAEDLIKLTQNPNIQILHSFPALCTMIAMAVLLHKNIKSTYKVMKNHISIPLYLPALSNRCSTYKQMMTTLSSFVASVMNNQETGMQIMASIDQIYSNNHFVENISKLIKLLLASQK